MNNKDDIHYASIIVFLKSPKSIDDVVKRFKNDLTENQIINYFKGSDVNRFTKDEIGRYKSKDLELFKAKKYLKSLPPKWYKDTKTIIIIVISVVAIIVPAYQQYYFSNLSFEKSFYLKESDSLRLELNKQLEENKVIMDNIHSISIVKDSLK